MFYVLTVLELELRVAHVLGECSTDELIMPPASDGFFKCVAKGTVSGIRAPLN